MNIRFNQQIILKVIACLLMGTGISACMVGPDYQQPVFFTEKQVEKSLDLKPINTDLKLEDLPAIDFQDVVLKQLMIQARTNSPTIRKAMIQLRQARESLSITKAGLAPTFDISGEYHYQKESKNMGYLVEQDYYQAGLDMTWEIDIFGGQRRRIESAQADAQAAVASLQNIFVSLTAEVVSTYIQLRTSEELLSQAKSNLILQQEIYQLTKDQYETGLSDEIVLNQAGYLVESTKASIPQYEYQKEAAQNALAILVGVLPGELTTLLSSTSHNLVATPFVYNLKMLHQLPTHVIQNRPDVRAAEQALIAQNAAVGTAIAQMYPSVSLSTLFGFESLTYGKLWNHKSLGHTYTPQVGLPLFHFGALKNNVELQKSLKEEKVIAYEQQLLTAAQEIKNAMVSLEKEKVSYQSYQKSYQQIAQAAQLTREKYKNGLIDYSSVLDSEQRRLSAQTALIQSNSSLYQGVVTFYKSVGGDGAFSQK